MIVNNECLDFMFENGVPIANVNKIKCTGELERFNVQGDKPGSLNGWMIYRDGLTQSCTFGTWKDGYSYNWFSVDINELNKKEKSAAMKAAFEARVAAAKAKNITDLENKQLAAVSSAEAWNNSEDNGVDSHPYVLSKLITPYGARIEPNSMALLIPIMSGNGKIQSLQRIFPSGRKMFNKHGAIVGGHYLIDSEKRDHTNIIFITEGYATACTIHEITKTPVYVCFNAGNIKSVTATIKGLHPNHEIVICSDNDHEKKENAGELKAIDAANKLSVKVMLIEETRYGTDWNDIYKSVGKETTSAMFSHSFDKARIRRC